MTARASRPRRALAVAVAAITLLALLALAPVGAATAQEVAAPDEVGAEPPPEGWPEPPPLSAGAALLVDGGTGQVLAALDADRRVPVASTIKTLTALTVLRRASVDTEVTAGSEVEGLPFDGAGVGLRPGDRWTVAELLAGLIARSGNDAASVLAVHVGGSAERFVALMREDAAALGVSGARIETPHGLGDLDRLSARDLVVIARAALTDPRFAEIAAAPTVELPRIGRVASRNELLTRYPGADGVKTGHTAAAGRTLIASATRDGRRLIAVVLASADPDGHFTDAEALLDHGFDRFTRLPLGGEEPLLLLRRPGRWVELRAPATAVSFPVEPGLGPVREIDLPTEVTPRARADLTLTWAGHPLARVGLEVRGDTRIGGDGPGTWLVDRAYAAMRAATAADAWPAEARR